jgi:hypothetical protein
MKKIFVIIFLIVICNKTKAQQMDTILFFDYYYLPPATWPKGTKSSANFGMTLFFNKTDSVHLNSNDTSPRFKIYNYKNYIPFPRRIRVEGIRIIKPKRIDYIVRIQSEKRYSRKNYKLDTLFRLDSKLQPPFIFWQPLRQKYNTGECNFCPTHFEVANNEFLYKKNYQNPKLIQKLNAAIRYEYYLPEGRLVKLW